MTNHAIHDITDVAMPLFMDAGLADPAVYLRAAGGDPIDCRVMIDRDVQAFGYESRVATHMATLHALVAEVGTPTRGAVFVTAAERFVVDALVDADEVSVTLAVKPEAA